MPNIFVRSTTGNDANDGLSWATAKATLVAGAAALTEGDTLYVSQNHTENATATRSITFAGTAAKPNRMICVLDTDAVPTTESTTTITSNGTVVTSFQGSVFVYGLRASIGSGTSITQFNIATSTSADVIQNFMNCEFLFNTASTSTTTVLSIGNAGTGNTSRSRVTWTNCNLRLNSSGQQMVVSQDFTWRGGKLLAGNTVPSYLLRSSAQGRGAPVLVEGVDFSEAGSTIDLVNGSLSTGRIMFRNCALPLNWSGQLVQGVIDPGLRVEMHNCDSGNTNYRLWVAAFSGSIKSETTLVKNSGASDGNLPFSWKMETNANPGQGLVALESPEIARYNSTVTGTSTISLDILTDGTPLTNADVWLEVQFLGDVNTPKSGFVSGRVGPLVASTAHSSSSATWNTTGMVSPSRQRISVSISPKKTGMILCKVYLSKPGTVLYVDPMVQVT